VRKAWVHVGCGGEYKPSLFAVGLRYCIFDVWWIDGKVDVACGRNMRLEILHAVDRGLVGSWLYRGCRYTYVDAAVHLTGLI
jgi:hypothetical protein